MSMTPTTPFPERAVRAERETKWWRPKKRPPILGLDGVDLVVPRGSRFALLGPNGAGKSTLTKVLCTLTEPDAGEIVVAGHDVRRERVSVRRSIGVALQEVTLDPGATPQELLTFHARLFGTRRTEAARIAEALLERVQLEAEAHKRVATLSGGNQRRVHVALALVHQPSILFLDEPTVGMDPEGRELFWTEMRRLNAEEGCTLFLTTQYLEEAERHADQLAIIAGGRIAYRGDLESFNALSEFHSLEDRYLAFIRSTRNEEVVYE
jgi:ABC-2 type transport system ATP-binding protein